MPRRFLLKSPTPGPTRCQAVREGENRIVFRTLSTRPWGLPQVARWKTASNNEIACTEKHGVLTLVPITSVPAGHKVVGTRWVLKIKTDSTYKGRLVVQGFSQIPGMSVARDHEKRTITISQKGYTEDVVQLYVMEGCNPAYNPGVGLELFLNQPEEKWLNEVEKRRYQVIAGVVHVFRTSHPIQHSLRGQSAGESHAHAREGSNGGGDAPASLLGRVHGLIRHLQTGRHQGCFLFGY